MSSASKRCAKDGSRPTARKPPRSISTWRACCASCLHELLGELQSARMRANQQDRRGAVFPVPRKTVWAAPARSIRISNRSRNGWNGRNASRAGKAEEVAEAWHKIRPMDIEPILLLMEEKEKRNAFHTSLQYLAKAERIDSVHPAVRQSAAASAGGRASCGTCSRKNPIWRKRSWPRWRRCRRRSRATGRHTWRPCATWFRGSRRGRRSCRATRGSGARARKQSRPRRC